MVDKIFKIALWAAVVLAVIWAFAALTGSTATVSVGSTKSSKKRRSQLRRRRRVDGQIWQPAGVVAPMAQSAAVFSPPLAPVNPY